MDKEKMLGHIIEQNKPPLINAYKARVPSVNKPTNMARAPNTPKINKVLAGFSCP